MNASLVLLNGKIYTFNREKPRAEAVAVLDEKIVYVGEDKEASKLVGPNTQVINLNGKTVIPGLTDCHVHMASFGRSLSTLNLRDLTSITQLKRLVKEKAESLPPNAWIFGRGWDQEKFVEKRLPTR